MTKTEEQIDQFRPMLFSIAYNMLGSVADAEDMVQETYASWLKTEKGHVENPKFYLIRSVSNKSLTFLKKIKQERKAYLGTWLPEPLFTQPNENSNDIKTDLSIGFMYLLEKLTPMERGVTILREAFDLQYSEIAEIFDIAEDNCRQYLSRAKKKLQLEKSRYTVDKKEHEEILRKFLDASLSKNIDGIIDLLREDVTAYGDGGGKSPAILHPLSGKDNVLGLLLGGKGKSRPVYRMEILSANGLSCAAFYQTNKDTTPNILISIDIDDKKKISNIYYLANPEKLQHLSHKNF